MKYTYVDKAMFGQKFAFFLDLSLHGRKFLYRDTQNARCNIVRGARNE